MIYVTSDLHGCEPEVLFRLLRQADFGPEDYLFVLGDVIDRGAYGIDLLLWLLDQTNVQLILGNHEAMMLACDFLFQPVTDDSLNSLTVHRLNMVENWKYNGARPTLTHMRQLLRTDPEMAEAILDYLREAPAYECVSVGGRDFLLVHAGLDHFEPGKPLDAYALHDLIWARPTPETRYSTDFYTILGHTPTLYLDPRGQDRAFRTDTWMCIDTGAACGGSPMLLRLDDMKEFYENSEPID